MTALRELSEILAKVDDAETMYRFFNSILTKDEIRTIASRWELVKLLYEGVSQRNIGKKLGLSLCKITRGSRELRKQNSILKKIIVEHTELKAPEIYYQHRSK